MFTPADLIPAGTGYNVGTLQLAITVVVAAFDVVVVWFGFWIPMRRSVAAEDRKYLFRGIADYARASRLGEETNARLARLESERRAREGP